MVTPLTIVQLRGLENIAQTSTIVTRWHSLPAMIEELLIVSMKLESRFTGRFSRANMVAVGPGIRVKKPREPKLEASKLSLMRYVLDSKTRICVLSS